LFHSQCLFLSSDFTSRFISQISKANAYSSPFTYFLSRLAGDPLSMEKLSVYHASVVAAVSRLTCVHVNLDCAEQVAIPEPQQELDLNQTGDTTIFPSRVLLNPTLLPSECLHAISVFTEALAGSDEALLAWYATFSSHVPLDLSTLTAMD
jgi:hypothetical protein